MRQETDGVLLESFLIYEPEHEATWYKEGKPLLGALDYDERYQVQEILSAVKEDFTQKTYLFVAVVFSYINFRHRGIILVVSCLTTPCYVKARAHFNAFPTTIPQPFLERRGDWTYCALAIRRLCQDDAGNYTVTVKNRHGEKSNHVRLSMKNPNDPEKVPGGIEPAFFRKPTSRQEGNLLHLECEIEALPKPEIAWFLGERLIEESDKYKFFRTIQPSNPNIHFVRLTIKVG